MTSNNTETRATPNPYNAHKPWHDEVPDQKRDNAYTLYVPDRMKVREAQTQQPAPAPSETPPKEAAKSEGDTKKTDNYVKRYFDLKNHYDRSVVDYKARVEELTRQVESLSKQKPAETGQEVQPQDVNTPAPAQPTQAQIEKPTSQPPIDEKELRLRKAEALVAILEAHPDFNTITNSVNFHEWVDTQSDDVKASAYENHFDSDKAIAVLNMYKLHLEQSQKQKDTPATNDQDGADVMISTRTVDVNSNPEDKVWSVGEIKKLSTEDWEKHREQIFKQLGWLKK